MERFFLFETNKNKPTKPDQLQVLRQQQNWYCLKNQSVIESLSPRKTTYVVILR